MLDITQGAVGNEKPKEELLNATNYPILYKEIQKLAARVDQDHPQDKSPVRIIILNDCGWNADYYPEQRGFVGDVVPETIYISKNIVDKFPLEQVIAIVAHEIGHDMKNHSELIKENIQKTGLKKENEFLLSYDKYAQQYGEEQAKVLITKDIQQMANEIKQQQEFEADKFAMHYVNPQDLIKALGKLEGVNASTVVDETVTHPRTHERIERIKQLKNESTSLLGPLATPIPSSGEQSHFR